MKHFIKDIADQVTIDLMPMGRQLQFDQVNEVATGGGRFIKVHLSGIVDMEDEKITIDSATYTHDLETEEDPAMWEDFDDSEVRYLEKNMMY